MAFRGRRRFGRRRLNRGASRFAGGRLPGGRSLEWLGLNADGDGTLVTPTLTFGANGWDYAVFQMAPSPTSTSGTHTIERIVGFEAVYFRENIISAASDGTQPGAADRVVWSSIQVVPLIQDVAQLTNIKQITQVDHDAMEIMWQRIYMPERWSITAGGHFKLAGNSRGELGPIDVRVRRRIDFSEFYLAKVIAYPTTIGFTGIRQHLWLRGLFRQAGGLGA